MGERRINEWSQAVALDRRQLLNQFIEMARSRLKDDYKTERADVDTDISTIVQDLVSLLLDTQFLVNV